MDDEYAGIADVYDAWCLEVQEDIGFYVGMCVGTTTPVVELADLRRSRYSLGAVVPEDLPVDTIEEVGPGGHFFGTAHTQARFRNAFYRPLLSDWRNYEAWEEAGRPTADQKANRIWKELLATYEEPPFEPSRRAALEDFVARRKAEGGVKTDF